MSAEIAFYWSYGITAALFAVLIIIDIGGIDKTPKSKKIYKSVSVVTLPVSFVSVVLFIIHMAIKYGAQP